MKAERCFDENAKAYKDCVVTVEELGNLTETCKDVTDKDWEECKKTRECHDEAKRMKYWAESCGWEESSWPTWLKENWERK